jgi:uncharacterized protein YukE
MSSPFSMDTANQIAQTKGLLGLVEDAQGNIRQIQGVADQYLAVHSGQMADAGQSAMHDLNASMTQNNQVLQVIVDALHNTTNIVQNTESDNAAAVLKSAANYGGGFLGHH